MALDCLGCRPRKDIVCRLLLEKKKGKPPIVLTGSIDQDEAPILGIFHKNRNGHVFHDKVEQIAGSIASSLRCRSRSSATRSSTSSWVATHPPPAIVRETFWIVLPSAVFCTVLMVFPSAMAAARVAQYRSISSEKLPTSLRRAISSRYVT